MTTRRVRRSPEAARAEILAAAQSVLAEHEFGALTVDAVMQRTGMTRSSFYHYFPSVDSLAAALLEQLERDIRGSVDAWLGGDGGEDPRADTLRHLTDMFEAMEKHRIPVRALARAASGDSPVYQRWQSRVVDYFVERTADFIRRQVALGRSRVDDPDRLARALILMNDALASDAMLRPEPDDVVALARVVAGIWNASIFGAVPEAPR